jgi:hypothetical protein
MLTNVQFTKEDTRFKHACEIVRQNLPDYTEFRSSTRQASKFRRRKGIAYRNYVGDLPKEVRV